MVPPRPARRLALRWGSSDREDRLLEAAREIHGRLTGRDVHLGERVEGGRGLDLVVEAADPRGGPVRVGPDTTLELVRPPPETLRPVYDVLFVVDASYSMRKTDVRPTRYALACHHVESFVRAGTDVLRHVGLLAFTHEPRELRSLGPGTLDEAGLEDLTPRGRSRPAVALDHALEILQYEGDPAHHRAVILVTDGDGSPEGLEEAAESARNLGIEIHVAQVGREAPNATLLETAGRTGGVFSAEGPLSPLSRVFDAMARTVDVPASWTPPPPPGEDVEFEVVVRRVDDEEGSA